MSMVVSSHGAALPRGRGAEMIAERRTTSQRAAALALLERLRDFDGDREGFLGELRGVTERLVAKERRPPAENGPRSHACPFVDAPKEVVVPCRVETATYAAPPGPPPVAEEPLSTDPAARLRRVREMRLHQHHGDSRASTATTTATVAHGPTDQIRRREPPGPPRPSPGYTGRRVEPLREAEAEEEDHHDDICPPPPSLAAMMMMPPAGARDHRASPPPPMVMPTKKGLASSTEGRLRVLRSIFARAQKGNLAFGPAVAVALEHDLAAAEAWGTHFVKKAAQAVRDAKLGYCQWPDFEAVVLGVH